MNTLEEGSRPYIAGPMTGYPQFNFPAFDEARERLIKRGFHPISPADLDDPEARRWAMASPDGKLGSASPNNETWGDFLSRDVKLIADNSDGVAVLSGWEKSKGARLETFTAVLSGKPVVWESTLEPVSAFDLARAWTSILPHNGDHINDEVIDILYVIGAFI